MYKIQAGITNVLQPLFNSGKYKSQNEAKMSHQSQKQSCHAFYALISKMVHFPFES